MATLLQQTTPDTTPHQKSYWTIAPTVGQKAIRPEIADIYRAEYKAATWNVGWIETDAAVVLLATESGGEYGNSKLADGTYRWISQNAMKSTGKRGRMIQGHGGKPIHLWSRATKKHPFEFIGSMDLLSFHGEQPMVCELAQKEDQ